MLVEEKSKQYVSRGGGANRLLVEGEGQTVLVEGRGKQDVSGRGGVNRMLVEGEGQTDC